MNFYLTAIGSGNTLNYPHQKSYSGVLAIAENTLEHELIYHNNKENEKFQNISQKDIFELKFSNTNYKYLKCLKIEATDSIYDIGTEIINEMDKISAKFSQVKFHIEISAGYKRIGYILTLISYIRSEKIEKLTFLKHDQKEEIFPIIKIELHKKEKEILEGFRQGCTPEWNGKINMNKFVLTYPKNKKYIYKIIKKCKNMGLIDQNNRLTDFGNLYLDYC